MFDSGLILKIAVLAFLIIAFVINSRRYVTSYSNFFGKIILWLAIFMALITLYAFRFELTDVKHRLLSAIMPSYNWQTKENETILSRHRDGHFYLTAIANDKVPVKFLIDTGASAISLTHQDAINLGLDLKKLKYTQKSSTANGISYSAPIKIASLKVGNKVFYNVSASVNQSGLDISLLGMSVIGSFGHFKITKDLLILKP
jgi:aspartyl protease family protein